MPYYDVRFEDVLYGPAVCGGFELTANEALGFTQVSVKEETFPKGVLAVLEGHISADGEVGGGEQKLFASILLRVEAKNESEAENFPPPANLLSKIVDMMALEVSTSLEGNWEVLECDEVADTAPTEVEADSN